MLWKSLNRLLSAPYLVTIALGSILVGVFLAAGFLDHPNYNDESFYNPLVRYYDKLPLFSPLTDTTVHPVAIGPIFFQGHRFWSELVGPGDQLARTFSLAMMFVASIIWTAVASKLFSDAPFPLIATFWLLPFHGVFATCTLSESFMMPLLLLSVYCWILAVERERNGNGRSSAMLFCLCGIIIGAAQNIRPPLLVVSLGYLIFGALRLRTRWSILGPLIAILVQLPFWIRWGNIFPPGQRLGMMPQYVHLNGLFPDTSLHLLTVCGIFLWPALKADIKSRTTWLILTAGAAVWLLLGPDLRLNSEIRYRFVGPLLQFASISPIFRWATILPFLVGWVMICDSIRHLYLRDVDLPRQLMMSFAILAVIGFMRSPLAFDRYVACFLPLWLMAYWPEMTRFPWALRFCLLIMALQTILLFDRVWNPLYQLPSPVDYLGV